MKAENPGSKIKRFIDEFNKAAQGKENPPVFKKYIAIDIVRDYAVDNARQMQEIFGLETTSIVNDFMRIKGPVVQKRGKKEKILIVSFNSPIWNAESKVRDMDPQFIYANQIKKLACIGGADSDAVITHYPAVDVDR